MKTKYGKKVDPFYIDHYEIKDDHIFIYYIDGHYDIERFTEIKEREVIKKWIYQVSLRVEEISPLVISDIQKKIILEIIMCAGTAGIWYISSMIGFLTTDYEFMSLIIDFARAIGISGTLYVAYELIKDIKEHFELKKYSIYLSMRNQLERIKDARFYNGITQPEPLTINTIDDYSLKDVRRVRKNMYMLNIIPFPKKEA